jgi:hypothetical protein
MDMRHGMRVTFNGKEWDVLDRHPLNREWWLHRWQGGQWETTHAHEMSMDAADAAALSEPISESDKWTKAAFNIADGTTMPALPKRKTGYVLGKWGAHKRDDTRWQAWTITHLPTGLSVKHAANLQETRATLETLAAQDFPLLHAAAFGHKPAEADAAAADVARLKELLSV